jgi:hypothetical protein
MLRQLSIIISAALLSVLSLIPFGASTFPANSWWEWVPFPIDVGAVDNIAPVTQITGGPEAGSTVTDGTASFTFSSSETGSTFECTLVVGSAAGDWSSCTSPKSYTALADNNYTFRVRATDAAGNLGNTVPRNFNAGAARACVGTNVAASGTPEQNGAALMSAINGGSAGTFCIADGDYVVTKRAGGIGEGILATSDDTFYGVYTDGTPPIIRQTGTTSTDGVKFIFRGSGSGITFDGLDIRNAWYAYDGSANSGRGISGGEKVIVRNSRFIDNQNAGIGSMGRGLLVDNSYFADNGVLNATKTKLADGVTSNPRASAGVKSTEGMTIRNSTFVNNIWMGVWCDVDCDYLAVENSTFTGNGKGGVSYELTTGEPTTSNDTTMISAEWPVGSYSHITDNTLQNNGDLPTANHHPAILVNAGQNLFVDGNQIDGTKETAQAAGGPVGYGFMCQTSVRDADHTQTPAEQDAPNYVDGSRNIHVTNNTFGGDGASLATGKDYTYNLNDAAAPDTTYTIPIDPHCGIVEPATGEVTTQAGNTP